MNFSSAATFSTYFIIFASFKGTVMQIEKAQINDCLRISKVF